MRKKGQAIFAEAEAHAAVQPVASYNRGVFRALVALCLPLLAFAQQPELQLRAITSVQPHPTFITDAGDGSGRLFIGRQEGEIRVQNPGETGTRFFLGNMSGRVSCCGERGMLSAAFPPGFAQKRYFYVSYTDLAGDLVVSRFRLTPPGFADEGSETVILRVPHREFTTNYGGQLAFGPDGYLYIGTGDGGGDGDPLGNAQNPRSLLGKILRTDTEGPAQPYGIPAGNPFVNSIGVRPEIWAYGLRDPRRFSFDRASGDLYITDVGERYDEVDLQTAASGGGQNYGWNRTDGLHCYRPICTQSGLTPPVAEYARTGDGCRLVGGYVYRQTLPALQGSYIYGESCSGRIFELKRDGSAWTSSLLLDSDLTISAFGQDDAGSIYVADYTTGAVYLLFEGAPRIPKGGVVDSASFAPVLASGGLASVFGLGVAPVQGIIRAETLPLPTELAGVRVLVDGRPAPILAVASQPQEQVNFQVPWETSPGRAQIQVEVAGLPGLPIEVDIQPAAPAMFTAFSGGLSVAAALRANYQSLVVCQRGPFGILICPQARPGEVILLYVTGLGAVTYPPETGAGAPDTPLSHTVVPTDVWIGGEKARVQFSGLAPGYVGLYQINVEVPPLAPGVQGIGLQVGAYWSKPTNLRVGE
jgi:uncharacterized protein (TIGR03437 family)